ncbi:WAT1-related protein At5g40230-like isoform X1 [Durio zibethinus]|uniref:WAT1-related protein n=1 Tax=Durio zibethinus TaxID=66656 RepID=A0A6P5YLD9_DURZI|nr:WAT1-related protein At5g40230-like isoform X1 [Durio zibethinus]
MQYDDVQRFDIRKKKKEAFGFSILLFYSQEDRRPGRLYYRQSDMGRTYWYKDVLPCTAMVAVECSNVVINILFKAASSKGLSYYTFLAYCYTLATIVLLPVTFFLISKSGFPPFKFPLISRLCVLGLVGFSGQVCVYKGLEFGSPTLASAISNLIPAFTFVLAVFYRMEKVELRSSSTQAKILGTIASISGASVVVLYKGPIVLSSPHLTSSSVLIQRPLGSPQSNWVIGGLLLAMGYLFYSFWYIIQGIFALSFSSAVHSWGVRLKGAVYVTIFRPLSIVIAAVMSAMFLGDALFLGSVIGALILSAGLYAVLWGKAQEEEMTFDDSGSSSFGPSSNCNVSLLQSHNDEEM